MNIKFPFLLSVRNKCIILIPLGLVTVPISIGIGSFSYDFTVRIIILSALFFILGFIGGYKSQSSDPAVRQALGSSGKFTRIPWPLITSVNMANRYYASQIPHAPATIYLLVLLFFIPMFALLYVGERLGRHLFVQHYPDLAYFAEEPDNESGYPMVNKQL